VAICSFYAHTIQHGIDPSLVNQSLFSFYIISERVKMAMINIFICSYISSYYILQKSSSNKRNRLLNWFGASFIYRQDNNNNNNGTIYDFNWKTRPRPFGRPSGVPDTPPARLRSTTRTPAFCLQISRRWRGETRKSQRKSPSTSHYIYILIDYKLRLRVGAGGGVGSARGGGRCFLFSF
jgi:hypothetical protein